MDTTLAYAVLAALEGYVQDFAAERADAEKAFALKDHVTERERLFIERTHYGAAGEWAKVVSTDELLARIFPRDPLFHANLATGYLSSGDPEKALTEAQSAIRNGPRIVQAYFIAGDAFLQLNQADGAKAMMHRAIASGLDAPPVHDRLLYIALAEGDGKAEKQETDWLTNNQSILYLLKEQADNAAARGHALQARELFRKGASFPGLPPVLRDVFSSAAAQTDALFGSCSASSVREPPLIDAICNSTAAKKFNEQQAANGATPISGPEAYIRGLATLPGNSADAAAIFAQMVDRKVANWGPEYPAAQVGLARAAKAMGDTARAKKTYEQFFEFWKDADPDVPMLVQARKEYAALK